VTHHPTPPFSGAEQGALAPEELARMAQAAQAKFGGGLNPQPPGFPQAPPRAEAADVPPTRVAAFTYRTPDGDTHDLALTLRLLTFTERCLVAQRVAIALGGQSFDSVPLDDALHIRAAVWCDIAWPDSPKWLRDAWFGDATLAMALYEKGEGLRQDYFRGELLAGREAAKTPRLVFHSTEPAAGPR